jgi:hypothetical protein
MPIIRRNSHNIDHIFQRKNHNPTTSLLAGVVLSSILKSPVTGFGVMSGSFELYSLTQNSRVAQRNVLVTTRHNVLVFARHNILVTARQQKLESARRRTIGDTERKTGGIAGRSS